MRKTPLRKSLLTYSAALLYFSLGLIFGTIGPLVALFQIIGYATGETGWVGGSFYLGTFVAAAVAYFRLRRNLKFYYDLSIILMCVGLSFLTIGKDISLYILGLFLYGFGLGTVEVTITILSNIFKDVEAFNTLIRVPLPFAALAAPHIFKLFEEVWNFFYIFPLILLLVSFLLSYFSRIEENLRKNENVSNGFNTRVLLLMVAMFAYTIIEQGTSSWLPTFFLGKGLALVNANEIVSYFWMTFAVSRVMFIALVRKMGGMKTLIFLAIVSFTFSLLSLYITEAETSMLCWMITGAAIAPMFPLIIANAAVSGEIRDVSLVYGIGMLGPSIAVPLIGKLAEYIGIQYAMILIPSSALTILLTTYIIRSIEK